MKKLLGIGSFLLLLYIALLLSDPNASSLQNHFNLGKRIGLYGIISLGAGILIISGGIDLSIGAVVGLCATLLAVLLVDYRVPPPLGMLIVLLAGAVIGIINGLLVTRLRLQAFVVTLCGLFIYRGLARWLANDAIKGMGGEFEEYKKVLAGELFGVPMSFVVLLGLMALVTVFLHFSVYGRYLYAIGSNEKAARYSGIATDRYKVLAYVLCSTFAALFAILELMENNSAKPSTTGEFYELYAIAGAVLGGCSLRGGEGTVCGIFIGTAILWLLPNFNNMMGISSTLEKIVIGSALLLGAVLDELLRRRSAVRAGD